MFNWETEDSVDWDALESQQKLPGSNEPSRRWIWVLLLGVVLVGSAAAIIWRRVSTTLEETQLRIENDVLASVTIVHQTAQTQDSDLFTIFLSGKDSAWALAQERALRQNEMFARDALGMSWRPADSVDDAVLDFAPDLHSAQVTLTQTYDIDIGNGLTETAVLTQTAVYRLGPNRWLLSPPEAAFWGETRTYNGSLLSTTYFARDGSVARRLGRDLDDFLLTLCAEVDSGGCPPGLRVEAVLTGQSASFSEIIRLGPENGSVFRFAPFPSPTVAGWPTDELSYEALYRGYATVLGYFFLNEVVLEGYGGDNPFYHALRAELLWRTGIRPFTPPQLPRPPKTVSDLVPLDGLASLWRDTYTLPVTEWDAVDPLAYRFVALLLDEYDSSLPLLRALYAFHDGPFEQWMQEVSSLYGLDVPTLERLWLAAQFPETAVAQNPPPIPLPDQAIAMVCQNPPQPGYELHRFDLSNDYRELIGFIVGTPSALLALPGDERFVVGANAPSGQTSTLQVWQESGVVMLRWRQAFNQPMANPLGLDPRGQLVLLGGSGGDGGVLDHESCRTEQDCTYVAIDGIPIWSPDGSLSIVKSGTTVFSQGENAYGRLLVSDRLGQRAGLDEVLTRAILLGNGRSPVWISNSEVVWISEPTLIQQSAIMRSSVDEIEPEPVLTLTELRSALPDHFVYQDLSFNSVMMHPQKANSLLVTTAVSNPSTSPNFLLEYDLESGTGVILEVYNSSLIPDLKLQHFSPNGRFALISYFNEQRDRHELLVFDFDTRRQQLYPLNDRVLEPVYNSTSWSADSSWLLLADGGYLRLISPEFDYEQIRIFGKSACSAAVWLNK